MFLNARPTNVFVARRWTWLITHPVALTRLGDPRARETFRRVLQEAKERDFVERLEDCRYIYGTWLLEMLVPRLADESPAWQFKVEGIHIGPESLRVCDLVTDVIAAKTQLLRTRVVPGAFAG